MIMTLLIFLGSILVLVGVHEAGHFFAAKAFGVYVIEYAIGMGPKLVSFRRGETRYSIRAIPFGGYVRMAGEDRREAGEDIPPDRVLYAKPPLVRAAISLAGPACNLLLTFIVSVAVVWSLPFPILQAAEMIDGQPAETSLEPGDRILAIDGHRIFLMDQLTQAIQRSSGNPLEFTIRRNEETQTLFLTPTFDEADDRYVVGAYFQGVTYTNELAVLPATSILGRAGLQAGDRIIAVDDVEIESAIGLLVELERKSGEATLSVTRNGEAFTVEIGDREELNDELLAILPFNDLGVDSQHVGFGAGIVLGAGQFARYVALLGDVVGGIITGRVSASEALQGPVGVARTLGEGFRMGPAVFLQLLAFLSLNFGLLNLVPFPGLDGSRIAFAVYERVRGKPIPVEREGLIHAIGFFILIGVMILITYKDLVSLFR